MKKLFFKLWVMITISISPAISFAQDFIKTDIGFTFLGGSSFIQSFDFNLNRTDEVQNKEGGHYFVYNKDRFYIIPTIDANLGESVKSAGNNIVTQISFGKRFKDQITSHGLWNHFLKIGLELSPTYNADKSFDEKLYYAQIKIYLNKVFSHNKSKNSDSYIDKTFSIGVNPILNLGSHDSKIYQTDQSYTAAGLNSAIILRLNKLDPDKHDPYENWAFKASGNGYRLFSEIKKIYEKDYYGQLSASIDKSIKPGKISANITYKYGNDNAKYNTINSLTFGFKYKY